MSRKDAPQTGAVSSASEPRNRAVVWDVVLGWFLGAVGAGLMIGAVASAAGWDIRTPGGPGGPAGRALLEEATGQELSSPPVPFVAKVFLQQPVLWLSLIGVPFAITWQRGRSIVADFGLRFRAVDIPVGLAAGLICQLAVLPAIYYPLQPFIDMEKIDDEAVKLGAEAATSPFGAISLVLLVAVGAPIFEEIAYRGGVMRSLVPRVGAWPAIVLSGVIFGLAHVQLVQLPALVMIGIVMGYLAHREDRIGPAVWAHVGFNATAAWSLLS